MTTRVGIAGSVRKASLNAALLHAAAGLMPADAKLYIGTIKGILLYDGDTKISWAIVQLISRP